MPKLNFHDKALLTSTIVARCNCYPQRQYEKQEMEVLIILQQYDMKLKKGRTDPTIPNGRDK